MKTFRPILLFLVMASQAGANVGGYYRGGVEHSGALDGFDPSATDKIRIIHEQLTILLKPEAADVEVRYVMRNQTAAPVTARFGFPVAESHDIDVFNQNEEQQRWNEPRQLGGYRIRAGDRVLKSRFQPETESFKGKKFSRSGRTLLRSLSGWMVSEARFPVDEDVHLAVTYQSKYPRDRQVGDGFGDLDPEIFSYLLSTGACWSGTIACGRIVIRAAGVNPAEVRVLKPAKRFVKHGNDWVWEFNELEPTLADDIEVEVTPAISYFDNFVGVLGGKEGDEGFYESRDGRWTVTHRSYDVKASSNLPPEGDIRYDAANLEDKNPNTVWSEGAVGPGIGEWLELRLRVVKPLDGLRITPGFAGNPKLYAANARPKRLRVELNGEHSFTCEIADYPRSQNIPVGKYRKPVKTIKLTILEVWPGSKHEDLCIADLEVVSQLEKMPDLHLTE